MFEGQIDSLRGAFTTGASAYPTPGRDKSVPTIYK